MNRGERKIKGRRYAREGEITRRKNKTEESIEKGKEN